MLFFWLVSGFASSDVLAADFDDLVLPIIENHCTDCHGMPDEFPEGDFSIAKYTKRESVLGARRDWKKILDVVEGHEMPPEDAEDLSDIDRRRLLEWIRGALAEPEIDGQVNPGKPVPRRLTRLEYNNTVRDLLGLETDVFMFSERLPFNKDYFDPAGGKMPDQLHIDAREYGAKYPVLLPDAGLPGDTRAEHGFTNRGDAQNLTAVSLDVYVALAEQISFHPELLSRAERLQEIFPGATFRSLPEPSQPSPKVNQVATSPGKLAPNDNVSRTGDGSDFTLDVFRKRLAVAFDEDRGGVYDVSENANTTIAGKGGVLHLAYGKNANRSFGVNPSEDIWNAAFATAEASSGDVLFTNKVKNQKEFFFGFQRSGGQEFSGIAEIGVVVLSRRGQSGTVRVSVEFDADESKTVEVRLNEGAGTDNVFVSFAAPSGRSIRRLRVDGSDFSGDYVLLDDLAFITRDSPSKQADIVGRETPRGEFFQLANPDPTNRKRETYAKKIDLTVVDGTPRERLRHFMQRAFRRPVEDSETDLYLRLYEQARSSGVDDELAMRSAIHGVLSSPSFLYLLEHGDSDSDSSICGLTDHELASRLSYFLWSSMPDDELLSLADRGQLGDPTEIEKQVDRMIRNPRVSELSENFFVEWLHLRELWSAQPDERKFRSFYEGPKGKRTLARDMFCEPLLFFETILTEDRSILDLIDSNYTYINDRLAKHYGIETNAGSDRDWQRIELRGQNHAEAIRGGVLTTGAVMTLTSFPHRTSPIRRGAWVLETVFNRPPPPPKIAVADIDDQENVEHLTLREKVELHRANPACAVCHDRIDPPGFALENFDAIGRWREKDGDAPIDSSGSLRGLGAFASSTEFKRQLSAEKDRFVRGFVEQILSYALARELEYYDQAAIDKIVRAAADDDYRLSRIIVEVATSHPFRNMIREEQKVE
ncbi:DUF1592 domain-containing protein [Roseiconus nitratireducens]|nr:DUF1592 domain-containing protein [Roseiconus nitratireducens]